MIIGAIDTGKGIGFSLYDTDGGHFTSWEGTELDIETFAGCEIIIVEKFQQRSNVTVQDQAQKQNGVVQRFCELRNIKYVEQMPSDAKRFGRFGNDTHAKLKALGWYVKTKDEHRNDSANHLLRYLVKYKKLRADDTARLKELLR